MKTNVCYQGDCLEVMKTFEDNCIDLTVTSPPYDNLRTYNGYTFNFEEIAKELYRITKDGGVVVWVVGDATIKGSETGTSFKQALYFKEIGFNLHDTMIFHKLNVPPSVNFLHNRYEQEWEYMFIFSKGKPKTFNVIRVPKVYEEKRMFANGHRKKDGSFTVKPFSDKKDKVKRNIWSYVTSGGSSEKIASKHPAIFPEKLAEDHIISWSNEGDIVFDPMAGSGTTLKMAKLNNRNFIGIEISSEYCDIIKERVGCEIIKGVDQDCFTDEFKATGKWRMDGIADKLIELEAIKKDRISKSICPECGGRLVKTKYGMTCEDCLNDY